MKLISFDYTKSDGSITHREFIELYKPSSLHFGIDVSELEEDERIELAAAISKEFDFYNTKLNELMHSFDVSKSFRQFKPEGMSNIEATEF